MQISQVKARGVQIAATTMQTPRCDIAEMGQEVEHVHIHQLRHSFATRNVNAGMSAAVLQQLMGHAG